MADSWSSGAVLLPAAPDSNWWDRKAFSGAVVAKCEKNSCYRMYYYGRARDEWNFGVKPFNVFLPTGRIGMATSEDGYRFERAKGPLYEGAVMDPSDDPSAFDAVHIGVGDVIRHNDRWWMFYFGAGMEEVALFGSVRRGVKLQSGVATSDDGLNFERIEKPVLCVGKEGEWDQNGASWPRVLPPRTAGDKWLMSYHTRENGGHNNMGFFSAGVATSDDGLLWHKQGKVLECGKPGSWDEGGVSVRHVLRIGDEFVMFYEGSNYQYEFAIGLATSEDGLVWRRDEQCGDEPGGPILRARRGEEVWDNWIVATPYVVKMEDGSLRMYYLGVGKKEGEEQQQQGIGLALSDGDFRTWKRYCVPFEKFGS
ncbi:uncharacterized protein LOC112351408 [Selaginella moellendorffii]|uniref:uncharacterized protein LOC112351408 n=1 Tax=Selaginella moellendorffii TaxID=88036 RepID=UPI000D1C7AF6|nr:uncharacterized protein LOC112351408 [Selaginella moellendorffii]|eukprot:XP_024545064.1 uncharacterized protein LOC112351408 [Selaginella moellendorffii]